MQNKIVKSNARPVVFQRQKETSYPFDIEEMTYSQLLALKYQIWSMNFPIDMFIKYNARVPGDLDRETYEKFSKRKTKGYKKEG